MFTSTPFRSVADRHPVRLGSRRQLDALAAEVLGRALAPQTRPELWVCLEARQPVTPWLGTLAAVARSGVPMHVFGVEPALARLTLGDAPSAYVHPVSPLSRLAHETDLLLLTREAGWGLVSHEDGREYADEQDRRFGHVATTERSEVAQAVAWLREHLVLAAA